MPAALPDIIIGSGPAGVSVAHALLARGRQVVMLDGGRTLSAGDEARRQAMAAIDPEAWDDARRADWQAPQLQAHGTEVRRFGSAFAIEPAAATFAATGGLALRASLATGGLSNFWGTAILPYRQKDMQGWPVSAADLAPHYAAVARFLPVAGREDALAPLFPALPVAGCSPIPPGPQAEAVLARPQRADHVTIGLARQAVGPGCRQCGMCLHGCPWRLMWHAGAEVEVLARRDGFRHAPGAPVLRFEECPDEVRVVRADGSALAGARVYLAAGVLGTARIVLGSRPGMDALPLLDSAQAFLPMLQPRRLARPADRMPFHTLPQLFAELDDPALSPHTVHAQVYGWNQYYARDLIQSYGRRLPGSAPLWTALARRLMVAQIFLHSSHSARAELRLAPDGRLAATVTANPATNAVMAGAAAALARPFRRAGLWPLRMALRHGAPASSFHAGGTLPMAATPGPGRTDVAGRPFGLSRVHVADASVLPEIPATTITLAVMANAHRIACL